MNKYINIQYKFDNFLLVSLSAQWCSIQQLRKLGMWTARLPINGPWIVLWYNFFICCFNHELIQNVNYILLNHHRGSCWKCGTSTSAAILLFLYPTSLPIISQPFSKPQFFSQFLCKDLLLISPQPFPIITIKLFLLESIFFLHFNTFIQTCICNFSLFSVTEIQNH